VLSRFSPGKNTVRSVGDWRSVPLSQCYGENAVQQSLEVIVRNSQPIILGSFRSLAAEMFYFLYLFCAIYSTGLYYSTVVLYSHSSGLITTQKGPADCYFSVTNNYYYSIDGTQLQYSTVLLLVTYDTVQCAVEQWRQNQHHHPQP